LKKPRLFYWEEAVDAWCLAPEKVENILDAESHFFRHGDEVEIRFKRMDMTDNEMDALQ
jgi:hypothetical protein